MWIRSLYRDIKFLNVVAKSGYLLLIKGILFVFDLFLLMKLVKASSKKGLFEIIRSAPFHFSRKFVFCAGKELLEKHKIVK